MNEFFRMISLDLCCVCFNSTFFLLYFYLQNINFKKCSIKEGRDVFVKFNVNEVPSFLFLRNGNEVDRLTGADPASLNSKLRKYVIIYLQFERRLALFLTLIIFF